MAQLPPKAPNMSQNWHSSASHQRMPIIANFISTTNNCTSATAQQQQTSWMEEFLDFTTARRGAHRRSMSDSVAFLEAPFIEECRNSTTAAMHASNGFDRLDDEQLMSMFSDDVSVVLPPTVSSSNPSTPSDHNTSIDDENNNKPIITPDQQPKTEPGEVESSCKLDSQPTPPSAGDSIVDPKRVKR